MKLFKRSNSGPAATMPAGIGFVIAPTAMVDAAARPKAVVPAPGGQISNSLQQRVVPCEQEVGKGRLRGRGVLVAVGAALSAGALALSTGSASAAAALIPVTSNTGVGVYNGPRPSSGKVGVPDLRLGDAIIANCWGRGADINRRGNVWYHTVSERYSATGQELFVTGWTYGAYVDGNAAFHEGSIPAC